MDNDNILITCRSAVVVPAGRGDMLVCFKPTKASIALARNAAGRAHAACRVTLLDGPRNDRARFTGQGLFAVVHADYQERTDTLLIQTIRLGIGN